MKKKKRRGVERSPGHLVDLQRLMRNFRSGLIEERSLKNSKVPGLILRKLAGTDIADCLEGIKHLVGKVGSAIPGPAVLDATKCGELSIVSYLCENGGDIHYENADGMSAVDVAVKHGHLELVRYFVDVQGINVDRRLAQHPSVNIYNTEIYSQSEIDEDRADTLHRNAEWPMVYLAAKYGHLDVVMFLEGRGADIHQPTADGETAFTTALNEAHFLELHPPKKCMKDGKNGGCQKEIAAFLRSKGAYSIYFEFDDSVPKHYNLAERSGECDHNITDPKVVGEDSKINLACEAYAQKVGVPVEELGFCYDGDEIDGEDTPRQLGIKGVNFIAVFLREYLDTTVTVWIESGEDLQCYTDTIHHEGKQTRKVEKIERTPYEMKRTENIGDVAVKFFGDRGLSPGHLLNSQFEFCHSGSDKLYPFSSCLSANTCTYDLCMSETNDQIQLVFKMNAIHPACQLGKLTDVQKSWRNWAKGFLDDPEAEASDDSANESEDDENESDDDDDDDDDDDNDEGDTNDDTNARMLRKLEAMAVKEAEQKQELEQQQEVRSRKLHEDRKARRKKKKKGGRRPMAAAATLRRRNIDDASADDPIRILAREKARLLEEATQREALLRQQAAEAAMAAAIIGLCAATRASVVANTSATHVLPLVRRKAAGVKIREEAALVASVEEQKAARMTAARAKREKKEANARERAELAREKAIEENIRLAESRELMLRSTAHKSEFAQIMEQQEEERVLETMQKEATIAWAALDEERNKP
jgi:hypothetical protein